MAKFGRYKKPPVLKKDDSVLLKKILSDHKFKSRIAKIKSIPVIKEKFDVPYIAGYNKDGTKVYFDRHLNTNFKGTDITPFIKIHEVTEKAIIDLYGLKYQQAHHFASHLEHQAIKEAGLDWVQYAKFLKPQIKHIHHEHIKSPPKDLDLTPYHDEVSDKKLYHVLQKKELQETKISLEYHDELNPKLWNGWILRPEVRAKLLEFAYAWAKFAKLPVYIIKDIVIIGGNVNYNYTSKSDIDVHLILDKSQINPNKEFVDEFLYDKKVLWTSTHKISIYGYSIEPYAQDSGQEFSKGQGVFSILKNEWIQRPEHGEYNFKNDTNLKKKVMYYVKLIDSIIKGKMDEDVVKDLKKKFSEMRTAGITSNGEFSFENLLYKELRNRGSLEKLNKYEKSIKSQQLSLR